MDGASDLPDDLEREERVSKILRGVVAGWGANKMGCGCFGTIIAFFILYALLGNFGIFQ